MTLAADAKIKDLVNGGLMRDSFGYVDKVTQNCYLMYGKRGWLGEHIRVRIGRVGNGTSPHYMLEYVSNVFQPDKKFIESQFDKQGSPQQFSGPSHQPKVIGFDRKTWSTEVQTLAELEELKQRLKTGSLRLP